MDMIWWVSAAVGSVILNLIASELFGWSPHIAEWLVRCAARRLVLGMQERMIEEWHAHLQAIPGGLSKIMAAVGFLAATRQINVALKVRERREAADPDRQDYVKRDKHRAWHWKHGKIRFEIVRDLTPEDIARLEEDDRRDAGHDGGSSEQRSFLDTPILPDWFKSKLPGAVKPSTDEEGAPRATRRRGR
jgi:hypothetical protein